MDTATAPPAHAKPTSPTCLKLDSKVDIIMKDIGTEESRGKGISGEDISKIDIPAADNIKQNVKHLLNGEEDATVHADAMNKDLSIDTLQHISTEKTAPSQKSFHSAKGNALNCEADIDVEMAETAEGSLNATAPAATTPLHIESVQSIIHNDSETGSSSLMTSKASVDSEMKQGPDVKDTGTSTDTINKMTELDGIRKTSETNGSNTHIENKKEQGISDEQAVHEALPNNPQHEVKSTSQSSGPNQVTSFNDGRKNTISKIAPPLEKDPSQEETPKNTLSVSTPARGSILSITAPTPTIESQPLAKAGKSTDSSIPTKSAAIIQPSMERPTSQPQQQPPSSSGKGKKTVKSELETTYAPYILPSDKSIDDARHRLRTAIEQSLSLRKAFTERLYEKYRVILRPVPKSVDEMISTIKSDPKTMHSQLMQQISAIQSEKDAEKKVAQQINTEMAAANNPTEVAAILGGLTGVENADQLSWCGAGLNLVILPEEDVEESELAARGIKERAPVDPKTGSKIRHLSAAAAIASSAMLERVRKGADIRRNRIRKQQSGGLGIDLADMSVRQILPAANIQTNQHLSFTSNARNDVKIGTKTSKGKTTTGSLTSLLSMSADAEGIRPNGKPSAVAFALINHSIKTLPSDAAKSSIPQHQLRHPFPQSKGARSISYIMSGNPSQHPFALPNISKAIDRKKLISYRTGSIDPLNVGSVKSSLKSIVERLVVESPPSVTDIASSNKVCSTARRRYGLKRKVSEISVLRSSSLKKPKKDITASNKNTSSAAKSLLKEKSSDEADPLLAMSVMQALGLISNASTSRENKRMIDDCIMIDEILSKIQKSSMKKLGVGESSEEDKTQLNSIKFPSGLKQTTVVHEILDASVPKPPQQSQQRNEMKTPCAPSELQSEKAKIASSVSPLPMIEASALSKTNAPVNENSAYVPSLRGGGVDSDGTNDKSSKDKNSMSKSNRTALVNARQSVDLDKALWNQQNGRPDVNAISQDASSMISPQHQAYAMMAAGMMPDQVSPTLYQQANHSNNMSVAMNIGVLQGANLRPISAQNQFRSQAFQTINNAQMQNQLQLQQAAAALQSSQFLRTNGNGDIGDYFGSMRQVLPQTYTTHGTDWTTLAAQQGLLQGLPTATIDQASLGLSPHQAAILVRDRNTQVLLAREQQQQLQAQVAAAHQNVAAAQMAITQANFLTNSSQSFGNRSQSSDNGSAREFASKFSRSLSAPIKKNIPFANSLVAENMTAAATVDKGKTNGTKNRKAHRPLLRPSSAPVPIDADKIVALSRTKAKSTKSPSEDKPVVKAVLRSEKVKPKSSSTKPLTSLVAKAPSKAPFKAPSKAPSKTPSIETKSDSHHPPQKQISRAETSTSSNKEISGKNVISKPSTKNTAQQKSQSVACAPQKPIAGIAGITRAPKIGKKEAPTPRSESTRDANIISSATSSGMKMMIPARSTLITEKEAHAILKGRFHDTLRTVNKKDAPDYSNVEAEKKIRLVNIALFDYLMKVGTAVPIPKTLVANPLKERLNTPFLKSTIVGLSSKTVSKISPTDVIGLVINAWLWANYQDTFKMVFAKSGRIDVDPTCKWLIRATIEKATDEFVAKGLETIQSATSAQYVTNSQWSHTPMKIAKLINTALSRGIRLSPSVNAAIPNIDSLVDHLDELRMKALRVKCQERVLLASLISKRTRMSEAFSNSFTSSMVRAGAALGYDDLGEIVQNELTKSSSQMPFDILSDASGAWEDPCRPLGGYRSNLDSDELLKRAHARAMIQRSLKKLQDRHGIKGGTSSAGPYSDAPNDQAVYKGSPIPAQRPSPRSGSKRRSSFSTAEGTNAAATAALYNPTHYSSPFIWDLDQAHNTPYGRSSGNISNRNRSPSGVGRNLSKLPGSAKRLKISKDGEEIETTIIQSTKAIEWSTIASMFENVKHVEKPSSSSKAKDHDDHNVAVPLGSKIVAPFCRKIEDLPSDEESDSDDEIFDDEHILSEHQNVLETIKEKFDTMMRIRQEYQDRSRKASFGR